MRKILFLVSALLVVGLARQSQAGEWRAKNQDRDGEVVQAGFHKLHPKHWGCHGSLVIDARMKPHHAPPLVEDAEVARRVDALGAAGGPLAGII